MTPVSTSTPCSGAARFTSSLASVLRRSVCWGACVALLTPALAQTGANAWRVSSFVGRELINNTGPADNPESADGQGAVARFLSPGSIAVDQAGNLYVADTTNHTIRKVTPAGLVTTLAGRAGAMGLVNGAGDVARFRFPRGIAVDATGNVYVADGDNNVIRRISPAGVVSTFAGQPGVQRLINGTGTAAAFFSLDALAVDAAGNLYVGDYAVLRRITPAGVVTTLAGAPYTGVPLNTDGAGTAARFGYIAGLAVDASGNVYVSDTGDSFAFPPEGNFTIRRVTPAGVVSTIAGQPGQLGSVDGTGAAARFRAPGGLAVDREGNILVADSGNATIRRLTPTGVVTTLAGQAGATGRIDGLGATARFANPKGVAVAPDGTAYVADVNNRMIRKLTFGPAASSRLTNLAIRSAAGAGDQTLIVGFVIADNAKTILVRGVGPALVPFGVTDALADPRLTLFEGSRIVATNDNWDSAGGPDKINAARTVGAFALTARSLDAATLSTVSNGAYTAQISGAGASAGIALLEVYDVDATRSARFSNVSARTQVGRGDAVLIAGFAVTGDAPKTVLIRGVGGATLAQFGVAGVLVDPMLAVFSGANQIAANDNWGTAANAVQITEATARLTFPLAADSRDAGTLLTLQPGTYTAQLSGVGDTSGVALLEVYEVP